jgi:hypothetical protein
MNPELLPERYLGDGVYASFDGYQIWLRVIGLSGHHRIALDESVLAALSQYAADLRQAAEQQEQKA